MAEPYTSDLAKHMEAMITMLAACARFQTMVGAVDATAAKSRIVEVWGGLPRDTGTIDSRTGKTLPTDATAESDAFPIAAPHAYVMNDTWDVDETAFRFEEVDYRDVIMLVIPYASGFPAEIARNAQNVADVIRQEMQDQAGEVGKLFDFRLSTERLTAAEIQHEIGELRDHSVYRLVVAGRG